MSHQDQDSALGSPYLSSFQEAFVAWFRDDPKRFALPVSLGSVTSERLVLHVQGIHSAINISIEDHADINVWVEWEDVDWDQLLWLFASEEPGPNGTGWIDDSVLPDFRVVHPTREDLWRANVFEDLLTWVNEVLAHATHLAMWGSADDPTWARLVRDGKVLRASWTIEENGGAPAHLLKVHGHVASYTNNGTSQTVSSAGLSPIVDDQEIG